MNLSLKARNAIAIIILLIVTISIILGVAYHEMLEVLYKDIDSDLHQESQTICSIIENEYINESNTDLNWRDEINAFMLPRKLKDRPIFRIWRQGDTNNLLTSDSIDSERYQHLLDVAKPSNPKKDYLIMSIQVGDEEYRAIWKIFQPADHAHQYNIVIAKSTDYALHEIEEFKRFLLILGGIITAISGLLVTLIIRKGLKPVGKLAKKLQCVSYENVGEQEFNFGDIPPELRPFVHSTANMLNRINASIVQQKEFISDAAHELRTPLTIIKSTLQASLLKDKSQESYRNAIEDGLNDIRRMEQLINQLLELARVENDNTLNHVILRLDGLLSGVVNQFNALHESANIIFDQVPCEVSGSWDELISLFSNLIDNAVKHGPNKGKINVVMKTFDGSVVVSIHDDGGKISPEELEKIFERFYRIDQSRTRDSGGSGIGLSIAQRIAARHGGKITVVSNPEEGTTFSVKLPRL